MAAFQKRGKSWRAIVRKTGYGTHTATFDTKAEAQRWATDREARMARNEPIGPPKTSMTLGDALAKYEREVSRKKKGYRDELYRVRRWQESPLAERKLEAIRSPDMALWRDKRLEDGAANSTVRNEVSLISNLYSVARKEWGMEHLANPVSNIRLPVADNKRDRVFKPGEERRLMKAAQEVSDWLPGVIVFALETASRRGEIAQLMAEDIEGRVAVFRDTKNGDTRRVPLTKKALEALPKKESGPLFPKAATISHVFRNAVKKAGLEDFRFHDLRHVATSRLCKSGRLSLVEVSAITGHKDLHMLNRYFHTSAEELLEKLDD